MLPLYHAAVYQCYRKPLTHSWHCARLPAVIPLPRLGSGKTHDSSIPATATPEDPRVGSTIEGLPYDIVYGDLIHEHDVL